MEISVQTSSALPGIEWTTPLVDNVVGSLKESSESWAMAGTRCQLYQMCGLDATWDILRDRSTESGRCGNSNCGRGWWCGVGLRRTFRKAGLGTTHCGAAQPHTPKPLDNITFYQPVAWRNDDDVAGLTFGPAVLCGQENTAGKREGFEQIVVFLVQRCENL